MAPETKSSKRKGTTEGAPKAKKPKKDGSVAESAAKPVTARAKKEVLGSENGTAAPAKASRKRAADYFEGREPAATEPAPSVSVPKAKKAKKGESIVETPEEPSEAPIKKGKKSKTPATAAKTNEEKDVEIVDTSADKKRKKKGKAVEKVEEEPTAEEAEAVEDEVDDQTAALLKGFESSEDEEEELDEPHDILNVPAVPSSRALQKQLEAAAKSDSERGVIYVGRIPHGFYEKQMREYFSQFGDITRLRLSRNKKTGASKHYAFVEFASEEVSQIVAKTMNGYLMFNHILQVRPVPKDRVHEDLFKGANSRFKAVPRNKIAGRQLKKPLDKQGWERRISKEKKRRAANAEKLKAVGYEFDEPTIKEVDDVHMVTIDSPSQQLLTEEAHQSADESGVVAAAQAAIKEAKKTKGKAGKKAVAEQAEAVLVESPSAATKTSRKSKAATKAVDESAVVEKAAKKVEKAITKGKKKATKA